MVDRIERSKDLIQELVESASTHVGQIATIITTAVADVAREIGEIITDGFEMREAAQRAKADTPEPYEDPAETDINLEASIEAPVIPQALDAPDADDPDSDDTGAIRDVTLDGMMEAPVTPDQ